MTESNLPHGQGHLPHGVTRWCQLKRTRQRPQRVLSNTGADFQKRVSFLQTCRFLQDIWALHSIICFTFWSFLQVLCSYPSLNTEHDTTKEDRTTVGQYVSDKFEIQFSYQISHPASCRHLNFEGESLSPFM